MSHTLVTFHAHPDDEALFTSGVMAKAAADGHRVVLVVATHGEAGDVDPGFLDEGETLRERRTAEVRKAAEILGVARVAFLGYCDSGLGQGHVPPPDAFSTADVTECAQRLATILDEEKADVLTIYDAQGGYGHPDHIAVHRVGVLAAELSKTPVVLEATINRDLLQRAMQLLSVFGIKLSEGVLPTDLDAALWFTPEAELTTAVDVRAYVPQKRAAMAAHASQVTSASGEPRNLGMFLALPEDQFALAFGTEWFVRHGALPGIAEDDVFAALSDF